MKLGLPGEKTMLVFLTNVMTGVKINDSLSLVRKINQITTFA